MDNTTVASSYKAWCTQYTQPWTTPAWEWLFSIPPLPINIITIEILQGLICSILALEVAKSEFSRPSSIFISHHNTIFYLSEVVPEHLVGDIRGFPQNIFFL